MSSSNSTFKLRTFAGVMGLTSAPIMRAVDHAGNKKPPESNGFISGSLNADCPSVRVSASWRNTLPGRATLWSMMLRAARAVCLRERLSSNVSNDQLCSVDRDRARLVAASDYSGVIRTWERTGLARRFDSASRDQKQQRKRDFGDDQGLLGVEPPRALVAVRRRETLRESCRLSTRGADAPAV
jgi:hypothetical protein